jgi:hypothetical protein
MADTIGRVAVPAPVASGLTFPLISDYQYGTDRGAMVITHRFGELATIGKQRFVVGFGPRKFRFKRDVLSVRDRARLITFFENVQGPFQTFTYNAPQADKSTLAYTVTWETAPLAIDELASWCKTGFNLVEVVDPAQAPQYPVNSTCLRFPSTALAAALEDQVQRIIPLIHIKVLDLAVPEIYLSDRRCFIGGQLYLPRVLELGEPGSDVIISQDMDGSADTFHCVLGNADRVMTRLANDTDLKYATIDFSLYHVGTGTVLQLWKGFIQDYVSDGSPKFTVDASDGMFQVAQQYPVRTISRTCWKKFNDGVNCPFSTHGTGGDPLACDYTFGLDPDGSQTAGANGCVQHGMEQFFGGLPIYPQGVRIKDNTTGTIGGFGRNTVTATSIISDSVWGQPLPDIWCNQGASALNAFWASALVIDVRDEGEFFEVLGIIGAGPLFAYAIDDTHSGLLISNADGYLVEIAPTADGFPAHGFKIANAGQSVATNNANGLRQVHGTDPTDQTATDDTFALSAGGKLGQKNRAAGVAFMELRYAKPPGITPSVPDQHTAQTPIAQGLTGWVFDASGGRVKAPGLTNPFWIAVNTLLRAVGANAEFDANGISTAALQLSYFALDSVNKGDGSGAAEIADDLADVLFGTGQETQFTFQGTIAQQKPLRDWITEILANALGYFTWEFGKLRLGCRENASAETVFTPGNMLFQSLRLSPIDASFERLIVDFADVNKQFQANSAEYLDKDHAAFYGRGGAPLTKRQHLSGSSTISQSARLAAVRTREELGGVTPAEWAAAREAVWGSTILALDTYPGQVVAIDHPDCPSVNGGLAKFRIKRWQLMKDYSVQLEGKTVTDSMYDLVVGPKPADALPPGLPAIHYPLPLGEWTPFEVRTLDPTLPFFGDFGDPNILREEWTFDLGQFAAMDRNGILIAEARVKGKQPVTQYITGCGAVNIDNGLITVLPTGGHLQGGKTFRICVCAADPLFQLSPPSNVLLVQTPAGTNTCSIKIDGVSWPTFTGLTYYVVFAAEADDLISGQPGSPGPNIRQCFQFLTHPSGGYGPASITLKGPLQRALMQAPNQNIAKVRAKAARLVHGGPIGAQITAWDDTTITATGMIGSGVDWSGRALIPIGRNGGSAPFVALPILAWNDTTGVFTPDVSSLTTAASGISVGDVFVVSLLTYDNSADPLHFTDTAFVNSGGVGLTPGAEKGLMARILGGYNRGASAYIADNDATGYTFDRPLPMNATSLLVICSPSWQYTADMPDVGNPNAATEMSIAMKVQDAAGASLLVAGFTVDKNGIEVAEPDAPMRMMYVFPIGRPLTFSFGQARVPADVAVGDETGCSPLPELGQYVSRWKAIVKNAPVGGSITVDIRDLTRSVVICTVTLSVSAWTFGNFAGVLLAGTTKVDAIVTGVGGSSPGQGVTILVY